MTGLQTLSTKCAEKFLSKSVHLKPNSRARYATYLKGFLDYLNIPFDVKVKVPKTLPDYIESSDIDQIVEWIKSKQSHKKSIDRDLTLLETARKTGMRRSELGNLKVQDVNLDKKGVWLLGELGCMGSGRRYSKKQYRGRTPFVITVTWYYVRMKKIVLIALVVLATGLVGVSCKGSSTEISTP
ncbi:MAG: hypothetical protein CL765_05165, partial [Chloroflexi bacterium]|nr:hypothetical protein [Chloroflexota bacterium]